jgi:hypothetical protein
MVRRPAQRAGLDFDPPGLVDELVQQTVSRPGGLALMALALDELYRRRTGNRLTETAYRGFGGLSGVVNARAQATFDRLPQAVRDRLHTVFGHLVVVDEHGVATRARAACQDVANAPDANELIDAFLGARLLVTDRGIGDATTIEVAHEALLREWPTLADWIITRADDLRLRRQVEATAENGRSTRRRREAPRRPAHTCGSRSDSIPRMPRSTGSGSTPRSPENRCAPFFARSGSAWSTSWTIPRRRTRGGRPSGTASPTLATQGPASASGWTARRTSSGATFQKAPLDLIEESPGAGTLRRHEPAALLQAARDSSRNRPEHVQVGDQGLGRGGLGPEARRGVVIGDPQHE